MLTTDPLVMVIPPAQLGCEKNGPHTDNGKWHYRCIIDTASANVGANVGATGAALTHASRKNSVGMSGGACVIAVERVDPGESLTIKVVWTPGRVSPSR